MPNNILLDDGIHVWKLFMLNESMKRRIPPINKANLVIMGLYKNPGSAIKLIPKFDNVAVPPKIKKISPKMNDKTAVTISFLLYKFN
ncbi:MAG: hypothetical protein U9Q69_02340 [Nanoarchaeota archaeon]|nr:hypothetical protein [Nanoarchaeota archaeon]